MLFFSSFQSIVQGMSSKRVARTLLESSEKRGEIGWWPQSSLCAPNRYIYDQRELECADIDLVITVFTYSATRADRILQKSVASTFVLLKK